MKSKDNLEKQLNKALINNNQDEITFVFESIYLTYHKLLGYIIAKYVIDSNDVDDLIMEVFLDFYKIMFKSKIKNIKYYLITMAKNKALSYLKTKQKLDIVYDDDIVYNAVDEDNSKYDLLINDLKKFLSEDEISIIILHIMYDYSFKEIAKKEGKSINTIKTKYYRSIEKVKEINEKRRKDI